MSNELQSYVISKRPELHISAWSRFVEFSSLFNRVHATLQPALSVGQSVGWSVGRSVGRSVTLYFFYDFISLTSLLLPKWSGDLKYGPCPPARDFGSRVSGLVTHSKSQKWPKMSKMSSVGPRFSLKVQVSLKNLCPGPFLTSPLDFPPSN